MRFVVENVYFGDRSVTEVAAELGITHSAVSQQRSEAMRLLRDGLAEHYGDGTAVEPVSRTTAARRSAYLARVAANAAAGVAGPCRTRRADGAWRGTLPVDLRRGDFLADT